MFHFPALPVGLHLHRLQRPALSPPPRDAGHCFWTGFSDGSRCEHCLSVDFQLAMFHCTCTCCSPANCCSVLFCSVPFSCSCYLLFQLTRQRLIQCKRAKDPILPFHHTSSLPIWPGKKKKKQMFKLLQTRSDSVAAFCSPNSSGNNATVTKDYQMQWHNYRVFSQLYCRHRCSSQIVNRIELRMPIGKN